MGFNSIKATEPLRGGILLFTTQSPEIPGTHLIDVGRMNTRSLDWESSALTASPLLRIKSVDLDA